jgi:hypothetical protein
MSTHNTGVCGALVSKSSARNYHHRSFSLALSPPSIILRFVPFPSFKCDHLLHKLDYLQHVLELECKTPTSKQSKQFLGDLGLVLSWYLIYMPYSIFPFLKDRKLS